MLANKQFAFQFNYLAYTRFLTCKQLLVAPYDECTKRAILLKVPINPEILIICNSIQYMFFSHTMLNTYVDILVNLDKKLDKIFGKI